MSATTARTTHSPTGTHRLRPQDTTVQLTMRHLFGLQRVTATVQLIDGRLRLGPAGELEGIDADLDVASFESGSKARDRLVLSAKFLDVERYERMTFASSGVETTGDGVWLVQGQLTARSQAAPVTLTVRPDGRPDGLGAVVTGRVDRYAHGVKAARGLASRYLQLRISTVAELLPATPVAARAEQTTCTSETGGI